MTKKESRLRWYYANRDRAKIMSRLWREKNVEKIQEYGRLYRERAKLRISERKKEWRSENLDRVNKVKNIWRKNNRDREIVVGKQWRLKNLAKERARSVNVVREWRKKNPEKYLALSRNYTARKIGAMGRHSANDIAEIMRLQNNKCAYCKDDIKKKNHVDHIIPLAGGGSNNRSNLQVLCPTCNCSKRAKDPIEFAQSLGFLL